MRKVPESYAACFQLVGETGLIPADLSLNLQKMARFRNMLVHVYWQVDDEMLFNIVKTNLNDLRKYCEAVVCLL